MIKCNAIASARIVYSEGQGKEANPYPYDTEARRQFDEEIERLEKDKAKNSGGEL